MAHTVLARKWRPKKFGDLVGQTNTVTILKNIISNQRLHHAYLLTGTRGVGKTTIARIIAKALNCINLNNSEPCCSCNNCLQIDNGRYVDVIEIDAASNTGVDNIREVLENAQYTPTSGKYKIYIIDEVHMLSKSAFNAMLKTLEEPPEHVVFILATTDPQKVPITILSRCLQLKLRNLPSAEIEQHLAWVLGQEQISFELAALSILANAAMGSMRDALSLTDQAIAFSHSTITAQCCEQMLGLSNDNSIYAILSTIINQDSQSLLTICEQLNNDGVDLEKSMSQINQALFQIGLAQLSAQPQLKPPLKELAKSLSVHDCQLYFEISNLGLDQLKKLDNKYPTFVMMLLRMLAFTLGSNQQKQIFVQNTNFNSEVVPITANDEVKDEPSVDLTHDKTPNNECLATEPQNSAAEFNGNWLEFTQNIDYARFPAYTGIAMILKNSQLEKFAEHVITISVDEKFREAVTAACVDLLEQILYEKFGRQYDLEVNFIAAADATLRIHELTLSQEKQQLAEESIKNDPIIKDLIDHFSAKILPNSIKPID